MTFASKLRSSAAGLRRHPARPLGKSATEKKSRRIIHFANGTENWHLLECSASACTSGDFTFEPDANKPWPFRPLRCRLPASGNNGHFITVLDRIGDKYVIGDPLEGKTKTIPSRNCAGIMTYRFLWSRLIE